MPDKLFHGGSSPDYISLLRPRTGTVAPPRFRWCDYPCFRYLSFPSVASVIDDFSRCEIMIPLKLFKQRHDPCAAPEITVSPALPCRAASPLK